MMPYKPKKIKRPWKPETKPFERVNSNYDLYNSHKWRKVSRLNLEKNPLCVACLARGEYTPADVTDHIVPIKKGGDIWNPKNHQSLCHKDHNAKSATERNKLK